MADIITRLKFETDEFQNRARRAASEINNISQQMEKGGVSVDHMNEKNLKLARTFGQMQTVSTTLKGKVSELSDAFVAWGHHYNMLTEQQKRSPYGKAIVQQLDLLKVRIREAKAEISGLEGKLSGGMGGRGFGKQFMSSMVPGIGMGAGVAAAMAAVKAIGMLKDVTMDAIRTNMEFEQSNANLAAVLGTTRSEIERLTINAKQLGATTLFTANEITELQTVLARRGFNEEQILNMTHGISNLAIATGTNLADAAELAGSTMQAFGMKATDMERIVSVLGVSTTKSALTTEKLGTALQYVAPTAKAAGYSLEDTVAMLGTLVNAGLDASTAGTSLRQIILAMSTDNGKLAKSFGRPVRGLEDFKAALEHVSDAEDLLSDASKDVRVTAVPALLALVNNIPGLESLRGELNDVNEALQKMADEQTNTLQGSTTLMKSAWDGLMLSLKSSNGIVKESVDLLTSLLNAITRARALAKGGEIALAMDEHGFTESDLNNAIEEYRRKGYSDNQIIQSATSKVSSYTGERDRMKALLFEGEALLSSYNGGIDENHTRAMEAWGNKAMAAFGVNSVAALGEKVKNRNRDIALNRAIITSVTPVEVATPGTSGTEGSGKSGGGKKTVTDATEEVYDAAKEAAKAEEKYTDAVELASKKEKQGLIDKDALNKKILSAEEERYSAYWEIYQKTKDTKYLDELDKLSVSIHTWRNIINENAKTAEEAKDLEKENKALEKEKIDADKQLLRQIKSAIGKKGWDAISRTEGGKALLGQYNALKLTKVDVPDEVWVQFVKDLNVQLEKLNLPTLELDIDTNTITKATTDVITYAKELAEASKKMQNLKTFSSIASEVKGGWSSIVSGIDAVTDAVDTMKDAIEGNASAWDVFKSVVNSTFSVMESVTSLLQTVNTLTAIGEALTKRKSMANISEASTAGAAAGAEGGKAVAGIPIVGPILAVAAIASIAAAVAMMYKKTEYHADGGFVGGPRGSDVVNAWLTPGELVLNRAQQGALAGQLAGSARRQQVVVTGYLSGRDIRFSADADNRSRGGSRGTYSRIR